VECEEREWLERPFIGRGGNGRGSRRWRWPMGGARGKTLANEGRFADVGAVLGRDVRVGTSARGRGTREVGGDRAGYGP
jgi:hypothetical protein